MELDSATLAKKITMRSSKQTFATIALMVDRELVDDAYRAYGYFRWIDDSIDQNTRSPARQVQLLERQKSFLNGSIHSERHSDLQPEEMILLDLIDRTPEQNVRLKSYISGMMEMMDFDLNRKGELISDAELSYYSDLLAKSVMDALQHFIGNRCPYPMTPDRNQAVIAAHITHMLRDTHDDLQMGYINIPKEYLEQERIQPDDFNHPAYRAWVKKRVVLARLGFQQGKRYINGLSNLRCRTVGLWYCARFEGVLDAIEQDGYRLRSGYDDLKGPSRWFKIGTLAAKVPLLHLLDAIRIRTRLHNP